MNDAPAIKRRTLALPWEKAVRMWLARQQTMVLTDDNLATLVDAVEQGRCVHANIRKFVRYLLSCNTARC